MSRTDKHKIEYLVALISDFAGTYKIKQQQAFNYLKRFKGIEFYERHYNVIHTQSFEDSIENLVQVCHKNGGTLL